MYFVFTNYEISTYQAITRPLLSRCPSTESTPGARRETAIWRTCWRRRSAPVNAKICDARRATLIARDSTRFSWRRARRGALADDFPGAIRGRTAIFAKRYAERCAHDPETRCGAQATEATIRKISQARYRFSKVPSRSRRSNSRRIHATGGTSFAQQTEAARDFNTPEINVN